MNSFKLLCMIATGVIIDGIRGNMVVKMAPKAVTVKEEHDLQAMLNRLALEQEDVDGDDAEDS